MPFVFIPDFVTVNQSVYMLIGRFFQQRLEKKYGQDINYGISEEEAGIFIKAVKEELGIALPEEYLKIWLLASLPYMGIIRRNVYNYFAILPPAWPSSKYVCLEQTLEEELGIALPEEYLKILRTINGIEYNGFILYGVDEERDSIACYTHFHNACLLVFGSK